MLRKLFQTSPVSTAKPSRLGYIGALDGLRALAVLAVLFYHADVLWLPGGFLGVEVFFVVSGYLITFLLLAEYRTHNSIDLKQFWARRARRLLPALFALILAVLVYSVFLLPDEVASLRGDVAAAFTYITNWYLIAAEKSYFETIGRPSLLRHLWSLAVEEQFYLVWPLAFALVLSRLKSRVAMLLLLLGAGVSALWMGVQYQPDADPSRIYYGTDTRAAGILIGAALAFVRIPRGDDIRTTLRRWFADIFALIACAGLVAIALTWTEFDSSLYQGGMMLVGVLTAFVIAGVVSPTSPFLGPILSLGVLRWIGLRSYSLYLWHWPVFMLSRPQLDTTLEGTPLLIARFAITFALAECSYRFIESPIRHGALGRAWTAWNSAQGLRRWGMGVAWMGIVATSALGMFFLGSAVIRAQTPQVPDYVLVVPDDSAVGMEFDDATETDSESPQPLQETATSSDMTSVSLLIPQEDPVESPADAAPLPQKAQVIEDSWVQIARSTRAPLANSLDVEKMELRRDRIQNGPRVARVPTVCSAACLARAEFLETKQGVIRPSKPIVRAFVRRATPKPSSSTPSTTAANSAPPPVAPEEAEVLAVGDSVMLGASNYLRKTVYAIDVDAKIGRQVPAALKILQARLDAQLIPPVVVVHLGNNGIFTARQFDEMMILLRDVPHVIFLTNKVPRKWQDPNNRALAEGVHKYPNAALVDWNATSAMHPEWFWNDGIHLRPEGAKFYANLIAEFVRQDTP